MSKYLICDFDDTFNRVDFFKSSLVKLITRRPFQVLTCIFQSKMNWVNFKKLVLFSYNIQSYQLSVNPVIHNFIQQNRKNYHKIILISATPQVFLDQIPTLVRYFDEVYGSTNVNLKGEKKLEFIIQNKLEPFDYIGDSTSDYIIFRNATRAYLCKNDKITLV